MNLPSGNDEHSYGKWPLSMGKSTFSMVMLNYQRVSSGLSNFVLEYQMDMI